jgi:peptidoglycan/xylan/chitin deacetylase (PgdA/CDA1 family)
VVPALGAVLAVLLAGCGSDEPQPAPPPETSTATTQEALPTTGPATSPEVSEPATPTSASTTTGPTTSLPEPTSSVTPAPTTGPGPTSRPSSTTRPTPTPTVTPPPITTPPDDLVGAWRGSDIESFRTDRSIVALTFDGGASNTGVADILATLAEEEVPATFFVTGQFARAYPASVRAIAAAGHPVGNHSDTHPHFPAATNEQIRTELRAADASISALTGTGTAPLFRFPFGDRTALDIEVVNEAGYVPVRWTVDTLGWQGTEEGITTAVVRQRVLDTLRPGQVVLMHVGAHPEDGSTVDADALPGLIDDLRARGYGFVTVTQLLAAGS